MDAITTDLKYTLRNIVKRPGFYGQIVVILALGIGVNSAIFTLMNALVLQPLPMTMRAVWCTSGRPCVATRSRNAGFPTSTLSTCAIV